MMIAYFICFFIAAASAAQERRDLPQFTSVRSVGAFNITISLGDQKPSAFVDAPNDEILRAVVTTVDSGTLLITFNKNIINLERPVTVELQSGVVNIIDLEGKTTAIVKQPIAAPNVQLSSSGMGYIQAAVQTDQLTVTQGGAGMMELSGSANNTRLSVFGSAKLAAKNLVVNQADVRIAGAGDIEVSVNQSVVGSVLGMGKLAYWGPATANVQSLGTGVIVQNGRPLAGGVEKMMGGLGLPNLGGFMQGMFRNA